MARRRNGYPLALERSFYRSLSKIIRGWSKAAQKRINVHLRQYVKGGTQILADADNSNDPMWTKYVQQALDLMSADIEAQQSDQDLENLVTRFVISVDNYSYNKVVHKKGIATRKVGINALNPLKDDPKLREYTWGKIVEDTNLIKSMRGRFIDQLKSDIYRNINDGGGISDMAHAISKRTGMTLRHADLIATDQTGKILAQVDKYRNVMTGSTRYIWRSMEDKRVRPKHRELDGKEFRYDDPSGGDNGQLPGEPIRCRCWAESID
ncbi:phage minor head protein [Lactobacillus sp. HT06-2]|uniref:phage minor head protein n=1 Tax=Lactobacillus sp. HT06-2 TaxID=2080222 RepID=UPI000CD8CE09|nr:phage minor head protein [Lactobacillus sp. HT06-2]